MTLLQGRQILKSRDDHSAVFMDKTELSGEPSLRLSTDAPCSWVNDAKDIRPDKLRSRIEPWLTALVQSEHLSLLIGSGLTHAVNGIAKCEKLPGMHPTQFGIFDDEISVESTRVADAAGREIGNFEDQVRVANELLRGIEIIPPVDITDGLTGSEQVLTLREGLTKAIESFTASLLEGERKLASAKLKNREQAFNYLVSFLMSFASRSGTRERLHLFTTNYDRYIEAGADVAGLRMIDRFVGTLAPVFRASRLDVDLHYNPPGIRGEPRYLEGVARFTKLHGSIDWVDSDGSIRRVGLPFGAKDAASYLAAPGTENMDALRLMIYPNSAKDRETTSYPYVELFRDFAAAICRPNSTLVCYGYSFGDEHINRVIEDMLTIPSAHVVIISYCDPLGRIMRLYDRLGKHAQFTLMIGDHLGDLRTLVDHYLPKPAIDRTTIRMAELLKARWNAVQGDNDSHENKSLDQEDPAS